MCVFLIYMPVNSSCKQDLDRLYLLRSSTSRLPTRGESTVTMMAPYPAFSAPATIQKRLVVCKTAHGSQAPLYITCISIHSIRYHGNCLPITGPQMKLSKIFILGNIHHNVISKAKESCQNIMFQACQHSSALSWLQHCMHSPSRPQTVLILLLIREAVKSRSCWTYSWKMRRGLPSLAAATPSKLVVAIVDTTCSMYMPISENHFCLRQQDLYLQSPDSC